MDRNIKMPPKMIIDIIKNHHINRKDFVVFEYQDADPSTGRDAARVTSWSFTHDFTRHYRKGKNNFRLSEDLYNKVAALTIKIN